MDALRDIWTIFLRELMHYRRNRVYWIAQIALPVLIIVFVGIPLGQQVSGGNYASYLASGLLVLTVTSGAIGGGFTLIEEMQRGFLRPILVAPVARTSIVIGKILARTLLSLILVLLMILVLGLMVDLRIAHPLILVGTLVGITFGFVGLGILVAAQIGQLEAFRTIAAFITIPLYLLSGMLFPIADMPLPMRWAATVNPLTYAVDLFRFATIEQNAQPLLLSAIAVLVFAVLMTLLATRAFDKRLTG